MIKNGFLVKQEVKKDSGVLDCQFMIDQANGHCFIKDGTENIILIDAEVA